MPLSASYAITCVSRGDAPAAQRRGEMFRIGSGWRPVSGVIGDRQVAIQMRVERAGNVPGAIGSFASGGLRQIEATIDAPANPDRSRCVASVVRAETSVRDASMCGTRQSSWRVLARAGFVTIPPLISVRY